MHSHKQDRLCFSPLLRPLQIAFIRRSSTRIHLTSVQRNSDLESLSNWLSRGAAWDANQSAGTETHIHKSLSISDCEMQGYLGTVMVRGLVSERAEEEGTVLLSIPLHSCIQDTLCPSAYDSSPWNVNMACFILQEMRNKDSSFLPYPATLPSSLPPDTPLLMTAEDILEIQYPQAMEAVAQYQRFASDSFGSLIDKFSRNEFLWVGPVGAKG